jgi:hypothetical protein
VGELNLSLCVVYLVRQVIAEMGPQFWPDGLWIPAMVMHGLREANDKLSEAERNALDCGVITFRDADDGSYRLNLCI